MKHRSIRPALATGLGLLALAGGTQAACYGDDQVAALAADIAARRPAPVPQGLTMADAECTRGKLNAQLAKTAGAVAGYKAGLTNPAVQKRFNHDAPVRGTLYASMLLPDGSTVDAAFGARPLFEADLLVRVSDAAINQAKTPEDVLKAIDQVIPFIELPDIVVDTPAQLTGAGLVAVNVGARLGIVGTPVAVERTAAFSNALRDMKVLLKADGAVIDTGTGSDILGHPLAAVVWLVQDLAREGLALQPGQVVSLGSFSKLSPPKPGLKVEAEYDGLPGRPRVAVQFK